MPSSNSFGLLLRSILSGLLLAAAWPAIGSLTPLVFIAWLPLLDAMRIALKQRKSAWYFFLHVWLTMLIWNLCTTYWLFLVSEPMSTRVFSVLGPNIANALIMTLPWMLAWKVHKRLGTLRGNFALLFYWVAFEYLHMNWDLQWPWLTLGNVFATSPNAVQWYSITGALGGTLWIMVMNTLLYKAWSVYCEAGMRIAIKKLPLPVLLILISLACSWFIAQGVSVSEAADQPQAEIVLIQPNVDPYKEKFGGVDPMAQLERMLDLARPAITPSTGAIILPETALQESANCGLSNGEVQLHGLWENDLTISRSVLRIQGFLDSNKTGAFVTGMSSAYLLDKNEPKRASARPLRGSDRYYESYNAALMVQANRELAVYHKSKLVPGVELLPFEDILGSLKFLSVDLGGTTGSLGVQDERTVFDAGNGLRIAPVICYESIYGDYVADFVRNGANVISVITNDGWWDDSPAYKHHLHYARLRAIEFRRDVVRSANTGISCHIDQLGRITEQTGWWEPAALKVQVNLNDELTFYARHGDWLGRAAVLLAAIMWLYALVARLRRKAS